MSIKAAMKKWLLLAGLNGALAVMAGASAAHSSALGGAAADTIRLAGNYHLTHALALGLAALAGRGQARARARISAALFLAGIIFFCGGLYLLALTANHVFAYMVPFGGLAFIAGWIALAFAALKLEEH